MSTNNKISNLINSQVPFFVRNDHQTFVAFLEAYYEYLEQANTTLSAGHTVERAKNFRDYLDIDKTLDDFTDQFYKRFLNLDPNTLADKKLILKNVQDFYRAKGSEKAYRFIMRAMFGEEIQFYYPKVDVLKASDGKWYIQRTLRVTGTTIEGSANTNLTGLQKFTNTKITGNNSNAFAIVESVQRFFEQGNQIDEILLSGIKGTFENGEKITASFIDDFDNTTKSITANVFGGLISSVAITNPGSGYSVGDVITVVGDGAGACVIVGRISTGNIGSLTIVNGGAGYQNGNYILVTGGGGSGGNAQVSGVNTDEYYHPNTYNLVITLASAESSTNIGNATYSNIGSGNANTTLINALSFFEYSDTGPAQSILVNNPGSYLSIPNYSVIANSRVLELGILGRTNVVSSGTGYSNSDYIIFENVPGGYGSGANANLIVNATGSIIRTNWLEVPGQILGGSGYDQTFLPTANIQTSTGSGGNVQVVAVLGQGATMTSANTVIGQILRLDIVNRGSNYSYAELDFTGEGDGTATGNAIAIPGVFTYPGRYLNDDGFISSTNYLQDRDYYQNHAYVLRIKRSIDDYRKILKDYIHPSGMKLWGQYELESDYHDYEPNTVTTSDSTEVIYKNGTYSSVNGDIQITLTSHGQSVNGNVYIEFTSGDVAPNTDNAALISNGMFMITEVADVNTFNVVHYSSQANTSGNAYVGLIVT
jgi:hypothetical protein